MVRVRGRDIGKTASVAQLLLHQSKPPSSKHTHLQGWKMELRGLAVRHHWCLASQRAATWSAALVIDPICARHTRCLAHEAGSEAGQGLRNTDDASGLPFAEHSPVSADVDFELRQWTGGPDMEVASALFQTARISTRQRRLGQPADAERRGASTYPRIHPEQYIYNCIYLYSARRCAVCTQGSRASTGLRMSMTRALRKSWTANPLDPGPSLSQAETATR